VDPEPAAATLPSAAPRTGLGSRRVAFSLDAVWLAIVAAFPFVVLNFSGLPVDDGDLWWTLALGRATWLAGALPTSDPLAYTSTPQPYLYAQWLAGLVLYGTYRLGGYELLIVLRAAIVAGTFALLYAGCRRAGAAPALAGICTILALPLINPGLSLRPQILALLPFALYLEATRLPAPPGSGRARLRAWLPLVMVFWANVHGSFLFGLGLVGIALVGHVGHLARTGRPPFVPVEPATTLAEWARATPGGRGRLSNLRLEPELGRLSWLLVLSALAPLVNPYGLGFLTYLRAYLSVNPGHGELGGMLTEWLPTGLDTPGGPAFFASLAAVGIAELAATWRNRGWPLSHGEALRLLVFGALGLRWIRGIVWWGLVAPAPLAGALQRALGCAGAPAPPRRSPANAVLVGLAGLVAVASLPWWRGDADGTSGAIERSPVVEAVDAVLADPPAGRPFHYIAWGPYLAWRGEPETRLFVDGRYEAYVPSVFEDYARLSEGGPGWETTLDQYSVDYLLLSRVGQAGLVAAIESSPAWRLVYAQDEVVVYRPRTSPPRESVSGS
jgi:hypothetical protein